MSPQRPLPEWADKAGHLLAAVPGFQSARIAGLLTDGLSHQSVLLDRGGESYVLRMDTAAVGALGLQRAREYRMASIVASAGLCPPWVESDPDAGWAIRQWWPGQALERQALDAGEVLTDIAGLLRSLHGLDAANGESADRQDRREPLARYAEDVATPEAEALRVEGDSALRDLDEFQSLASLCHNDLVCQNLIRHTAAAAGPVPALFLIDLEYAAIGDPYFDLATVIEHHGLGTGHAERLLAEYLGGSASREQSARLSHWRRYYRCLLGLWTLRVDDLA